MNKIKIRGKSGFRLALDSGAYSLFSKHGKKTGIGWDYSFFTSFEFEKYLEYYVELLRTHKGKFEFVVTLDVLTNPKLTWDIFVRLRKLVEEDYSVLPVIHPWEDIKWVERYASECDYIGFGSKTQSKYHLWADKAFSSAIKINPNIKIHGFAVSSQRNISSYPWYSVDATTPFYWARIGRIIVPYLSAGGKVQDIRRYHPVMITSRVPTAGEKHKARMSQPCQSSAVLSYLEELGISWEEASESPSARDAINLHYFLMYQDRKSEEFGKPFRYYVSGNFTEEGGCDKVPAYLYRWGHKHINYLGTAFVPALVTRVLSAHKKGI